MIRPVRLVRFLAAAAIAAPSLVLAQGAAYDIDPAHTVSGFSVKHLVISTVRGEFGKTSGAVVLDDKDPSKDSVTATIDVTSINTRVEQRDTHLKSPDFFDSAKFPAITFKSSKVEKAGEGKYKVTGDLTIKGTTKPVVLDVTGPTAEIKDPWGNARRGFAATTQINRKDFGLNWSKTIEAGPVVGDDVKIEIDGELVKQAAKAAAK